MVLFFLFVEYVERYDFSNRFAGLHVNERCIISYAFHMIKKLASISQLKMKFL